MKKEMFVLPILTAGFIAASSFAAQAGCGPDMTAMPCCSPTAGHESQDVQTNAVAEKLPQPVAAVFDNYVRIKNAQAQDSLQDVGNAAQVIVKAVRDDASKTLSATIAQQAEAVAAATDLPGAREAFKPLSQSLIEYVSKNSELAGTYRQVHCSMANADWLQKESTVNNPYLGKAMARCGQFVKSNGDEEHGHQGHSMPGMDM
jgi:hypothetical protein